jgi:NCAIR mutase (PurE)-related protein
MTPEFKVDYERGARIGLDEALFCESKTVDQISAIVDDVKAKTGRLLLTRLDGSKCSRATAPSSNSIPFHAPPFLANLTARRHPYIRDTVGRRRPASAHPHDQPVGRRSRP